MKTLLQKLVEESGPPGAEEKIRDIVKAEVKDYVDEIFEDALGNLICVRKGEGKKIMLAAHMDEVALMVTHIDEQGFLRFTKVGGVLPHLLVGERVIFSSGVIGTINHEKIKELKELDFSKLYIDIGASSKKEAENKVAVGDTCVYYRQFTDLGRRILAKSLDDRAGCAVMISALQKLKDDRINELYFVFTVQEEVGLRGAKTSAYRLDPDFGIAVDVTRTGDTPEAPTMAVSLGKGPAIKVKDSSVLAHPQVRDLMIEIAEKYKIPYQLEVLERGGTDAGAIHLTKEGIPSGALSIPCRYIHTPSEMIDYEDLQSAVNLLEKILTARWP
ncbi:MAG: M42 family metallopeptidase [Dethiobacteria bacterium]|jgi:putative aminopeptidase FrvX|nr:M42 family metallopeptidase [Bacillota bacterium]